MMSQCGLLRWWLQMEHITPRSPVCMRVLPNRKRSILIMGVPAFYFPWPHIALAALVGRDFVATH